MLKSIFYIPRCLPHKSWWNRTQKKIAKSFHPRTRIAFVFYLAYHELPVDIALLPPLPSATKVTTAFTWIFEKKKLSQNNSYDLQTEQRLNSDEKCLAIREFSFPAIHHKTFNGTTWKIRSWMFCRDVENSFDFNDFFYKYVPTNENWSITFILSPSLYQKWVEFINETL